MTTAGDDVNPRLPTWSGDWTQFRAFEQRVSFEIDSTKSDERTLLGPRLAKNLTGKAWELIEDIDREKLRAEDGAQFLIKYLQDQRGRDKVDLLGDAMRDLLLKQDVVRHEGEEFSEYYPRFKIYVKAVETALKEINAQKTMPPEFYGWFLLNVGMRMDPSDIAVIKGKAESYVLEKIENTLKIMWSGGGLAQKDSDRKRWKTVGKTYVAQEERQVTGIYDACEEDYEEGNEEDDPEQEQYEEMAAAVIENPDDEELMIAFQNAKKKMHYKEARKVLAKTRVSRDFYPVQKNGMRKGNDQKEEVFNGDCMRCGKYGHKARNCPQKSDRGKGYAKGGANYVALNENYMCITNMEKDEPIYAILQKDHDFKAIVDSGASETIIGVDTLQELYSLYEELGFDPREEIKIDRSLRKSFVFGNSAVSEAIGMATITIGLFGKECQLEAHVVDGAAPLLLSSKFMYQHEMVIDFKRGVVCLGERSEEVETLERAPSYHLMMSILNFPGRRRDDATITGRRTSESELAEYQEGQPAE